MTRFLFALLSLLLLAGKLTGFAQPARPRVIVTTDGEADDRASMVRFLLSANEFDVEGIVNSSSQFHWVGGTGWNAFHPVTWVPDYLKLYAQVYDKLKHHDPHYPTPAYLLSKWKVGNIAGVGEDSTRTEGAELIARVLLDERDARPIWVQAWGGCNTVARALKIIQEDHPAKMAAVARRLRLFLIWEQDETYQRYIRPNWEPLNVPTIIADQFDCLAYIWPKVLPATVKTYFSADWISSHLLQGHGPLCAAYENNHGAFNAEGDTPSFLYVIPNGLRSTELPSFGGWGGRYVQVRGNVWMDPLPAPDYVRPTGRWGIDNSWSKLLENDTAASQRAIRTAYFQPIWRWLAAVQNDFAARADWCVKDYAAANHPPVVRLRKTPLAISARAGAKLMLDATASTDPDGNALSFRWWHYAEAGTYAGPPLPETAAANATVVVPPAAPVGTTIHLVCEVTDAGTPALTRYQRVVITVVP